jgi:heptosyltransferase-2
MAFGYEKGRMMSAASDLRQRATSFYRDRVSLLLKHALPTLWFAWRHRQTSTAPTPGSFNILVTSLAGIGDFVLLTPLLRELRRNYQQSKITLVVFQNSAPLAKSCPYVDRVLTLERGPNDPIITRPRNLGPFIDYLRYLVSFARHEFAGRIDLAIQPKWDADTEFATLLTILSQAPRRIAYGEDTSAMKRWCNFGQDHLFTDVLPSTGVKHETELNLDLLRHLGGTVEQAKPELWATQEDEQRAATFLSQRGVPGDTPIIAFGVGGSQGRRHWPYYGELIESLHSRINFTPLLLAGPSERQLVEQILTVTPTAVVADELPLTTAVSLLSRCQAFVGNDSGPMHLAAVAKCPVIEISCHPLGADSSHGNSPDRFAPVTERKMIFRPRPASPQCRKGCIAETPHCIANIATDDVVAAVLQQMQSLPTHASLHEMLS